MRSRSIEHRIFMWPKFPRAFRLFYAVFEGTADDVRKRLANGDDPNAKSAQGINPLGHAVRIDLEKAAVLFEAGAEINVWDKLGMHPLHWIADREADRISWLLDRGVDPNVAVRQGTSKPFHPLGWTPLHIAAEWGNLEATALFVARGANANLASADGSTSLHVAAHCSRVYKRLIRVLIDAGINNDAVNDAGQTALHILCERNGRYSKAGIRLLISRGADVDVKDHSGRQPIDFILGDSLEADTLRAILSKSI